MVLIELLRWQRRGHWCGSKSSSVLVSRSKVHRFQKYSGAGNGECDWFYQFLAGTSFAAAVLIDNYGVLNRTENMCSNTLEETRLEKFLPDSVIGPTFNIGDDYWMYGLQWKHNHQLLIISLISCKCQLTSNFFHWESKKKKWKNWENFTGAYDWHCERQKCEFHRCWGFSPDLKSAHCLCEIVNPFSPFH